MIIKFVMKFLPTCLPSGLTVAAPDAFGRIPGVGTELPILFVCLSIHHRTWAISSTSIDGRAYVFYVTRSLQCDHAVTS